MNAFRVQYDPPFSSPHRFGGILKGADCPNCKKPFAVYFRLATEDKRLGISTRTPVIPFLYCLACPLAWEDFTYRVGENDSVELVSWNSGPPEPDYASLQRTFVERSVGLFEMSSFARLFTEKFNQLGDRDPVLLSQYDQFAAEIDPPPRCYEGSIDPVTQVGGEPIFLQGVDYPNCPHCAKTRKSQRVQMDCLASLVNDERVGLMFFDDMIQILLFRCPACELLLMRHRST